QTILFLLLLIPVFSFAQTEIQDANLAQYYYSQGDFDKAKVLYEKLYSKKPDNNDYYQGYYNTLVAQKNYDDAVKMVKKQIKRNPKNASYYIDLGQIYQTTGDEKNALASFNTAIENLSPDAGQVLGLATLFMNSGKYDMAVATYQKGRKLLNSNTIFSYELANVFVKKGDVAGAVSAYLDIVDNSADDMSNVQGYLQSLLEEQKYVAELQTQLYRRIQKNADNNVYPEMLMWMFVQRKDFDGALVQAKALDKRNKEQGARVFQLGQSAFTEAYYDAAAKSYQYIIDEYGKNGGYYMAAKTNLLQTLKTKITIANNYTEQDLTTLRDSYETYLGEFGRGVQTIGTQRELANLYARYIHNLDSSIAILSNTIKLRTNDNKSVAWCKLDLGDYYIMNNEVWDAMLMYGQVDKDFKDEPIAEEARFRNAKVSYYTGDFDWSKAQLDVLKGSTSELISNDAIALSVFIQDNTGLDTSYDAMNFYARADMLIFQNRNQEALDALDSLAIRFPATSLQDDILFAKARIYLQERKYEEAAKMFESLDESYSTDLLGDDATFQLAELEEKYMNNKDKAMELYKTILTKYPGSLYVIEARKRFRELRGDNLN
ncbi:MAG: tetratricopeptide repeat protein, partial [Bacteroidota bacterium]